MKLPSLKKLWAASILGTVVLAMGALAQGTEPTPAKRVNFGYSQNPKTKSKKEPDVKPEVATAPVVGNVYRQDRPVNESIANKTLEVVKNASRKSLPPTEHYRVGVGDVLFINVQNSSKGSTYFTVLNDGTIDYPLAGEMVSVAGLTTDEIEDQLRERIKLFENPQIAVKIRDYASHKITVIGLVEKAGDRFIQREAVPLFLVRAESLVNPTATKALIRRANAKIETIDLRDTQSENVLIFPGDIIEFLADQVHSPKSGAAYFYLGGEVNIFGRREFYDGITLTQAIIEAGGLKKDNVKKVIIRRKTSDGFLISSEFNLKSIKDGKMPDPFILAGDTVEVGN